MTELKEKEESPTTDNASVQSPLSEEENLSNQGISNVPTTLEFNIKMTGQELLENCNKLPVEDVNNYSGEYSIIGDTLDPPRPPTKPSIQLTEEQLHPLTPSIYVTRKEEAFSPQLQQFCLEFPIVAVRGLVSALDLDLLLFSTKTLKEANPDQQMEVRSQVLQPTDKNLDSSGNPVWLYVSTRSHTTISKYAAYQAKGFKDSIKGEDRVSSSRRGGKGLNKGPKEIKFGTNVDLSDDKKWKLQLQELDKLPEWARVVSGGNMLTHIGHAVLGVNTVQLYMKIFGTRTPAHQENNNYCSININIGPGDCEWFAVPNEYWGCVQALCHKNGLKFLQGSWWPNLQDLYDNGCPVYRFHQKPGDLVWVNIGCVHWVQAVGCCNNIAWNVGPINARQYEMAIERYEWNKLEQYKSLVPMVHLTWNLARNVPISEPRLFELIKTTLMRSFVQCMKMLEFVRSKNVEVRLQLRTEGDPSHYCGHCEIEVFNFLLALVQEEPADVHCVNCAKKKSQNLDGFVCLQEYTLEDLIRVYNNFKLHQTAVSGNNPQLPTSIQSSGE